MEKKTIRITESDIRRMVTESVIKTLNEAQTGELEEGLWDNLKSAWQGAKAGYNTQKFTDSDVNADYGNANTNYNAMVQGVKTKQDAAATYTKMINIARDYEQKAAALRKKMGDVYSAHGIERAQNRNQGQYASGFQNNDNSKAPSSTPGLLSRWRNRKDRLNGIAQDQTTNLQRGMGSTGTQRVSTAESRDAQLNRIIRESIYDVLNEGQVDEGLWDNIKAGWKGAKSGYQTQRNLDMDNSRFQNNAERLSNDIYHGGNFVDDLANKMYYRDAQSSGEQMYAQAQEYDNKAKEIRQMAQQLAQKWGVTAISKVGAKGPVQYGYGGRAVSKPTAPVTA